MLDETQIAIARQITNLGGALSAKLANMFIDEVESLQQENKRLLKVEADYKALQEIIDRARRLAFFAEEEEENPKFKMDADGNLTRLQGGTSNDMGS